MDLDTEWCARCRLLPANGWKIPAADDGRDFVSGSVERFQAYMVQVRGWGGLRSQLQPCERSSTCHVEQELAKKSSLKPANPKIACPFDRRHTGQAIIGFCEFFPV
jgi:hypothetical protein